MSGPRTGRPATAGHWFCGGGGRQPVTGPRVRPARVCGRPHPGATVGRQPHRARAIFRCLDCLKAPVHRWTRTPAFGPVSRSIVSIHPARAFRRCASRPRPTFRCAGCVVCRGQRQDLHRSFRPVGDGSTRARVSLGRRTAAASPAQSLDAVGIGPAGPLCRITRFAGCAPNRRTGR